MLQARRKWRASASDGPNMAVDECGVRLAERLKIKIGAAKNLPARSNGNTIRDTYCVLSLDQEEIFRTSIKERELSPFYNEEFQFEVPRGFRYLSIYVFDRDRQSKNDKVLGKVAIRRDELKIYETDHWFALGPVDADSEVQGKVNIEILFEDSSPKITNISDELSTSPTYSFNLSLDKSHVSSDDYESHACQIQSYDRKKTKNISKNLSEYCKESIKFGSCSSTSSRKLLSENPSLGRSESLKTNPMTIINNSGPSSLRMPKTSTSFNNIQENVHSKSHGTFEHIVFPTRTDVHTDYSVLQEQNQFVNCVVQQPDLKNKISVKILECSDLALKNGQCDPFAEVTVHYKSGKKVTKRTKAKKKTVNPKFDESFVFDLMLDNVSFRERETISHNTYTICPINTWGDVIQDVTVTLWHDTSFLGEVKLPLQTPEHRASLNTSAWYLLGPRHGPQSLGSWHQGLLEQARGSTPSGTQFSSVKPSSLGSLRLLLDHTIDRILPPPAYEKLKMLLLQPIQKPITSSAVYLLGEIVCSKGDSSQPQSKICDVAKPLVGLFTHADLLVPVIKALAEVELSTLTDTNTIFRGNTLVSKMMDEAMRLTGLSYLQNTLKKTLDVILSEKKCCEIDPTRVKDQQVLIANFLNLKEYVQKILDCITQSFIHCPAIMCRLFDALRQCAAQRFPRDTGVQYSVVSAFIFLRFFAPAILNPRLFDLTTEHFDPQTVRTLTLISKTIQTLGNFVSSRSSQQVSKEEYMAQLTSHFKDIHGNAIKQFLEIISSSTETQNNIQESTSILLKEGSMMKRTQRKKKFLRANMKRRYFRLTSCELTYSKGPGRSVDCSIPLADIVDARAVPPDKQNLSMNNMFNIVYRDRALFIQASNCVERKEWLDLLGKLCEGHHHKDYKRYHTESYLHGRWECCSETKMDAQGCASVAARSPPAGIHIRLDPARDLQRIHCLLYKNIKVIDKRLDQLRHGNVNDNQRNNLQIDDIESQKKTLKELRNVTFMLEDKHRAYQRYLDRETKYGSKQAPIGDDNYLNISRNADSDKNLIMSHRKYESGSSSYLCTNIQKNKTSISSSPSLVIPPTYSMKYTKQFEQLRLNNADAYLSQSLHIGSSTESLKDSDEKTKTNNTNNGGYLKMFPFKNDISIVESSGVTHSPMKKPSRGYSASEYVHVKPNVSMRDEALLIRGKKSPEHNNSQNFQEYHLLSNFTSSPKILNDMSDCGSNIEDVPPAIPPRNHHATSPDNMYKYKKPLTHLNKEVQSRNITDYEHKSLEQYQLRTSKSNIDSVEKDRSEGVTDDRINAAVNDECANEFHPNNTQVTHAAPSPILSQEIGSQYSSDVCDTTQQKDELCVNLIYSNQMHLEKVQKSDSAHFNQSDCEPASSSSPDSEILYRNACKEKSEPKEEAGFFSRKSDQRKSTPTKSKIGSKKTNSMDGGIETLDGPSRPPPSTKSHPPLSDRLTPSFFKKKTKVNTDSVRLPPIC